jgi:pimeloyl-ACP methyl ester carboxylesterase
VSRTAVLLLHGWNPDAGGSHADSWRQFCPYIQCQLEQSLYGLVGCNANCSGFSTSSTPDVYVVDTLDSWGTIDANVGHLEAYISTQPRLGSATALILVGHSMGGLIARAYAKAHPTRVQAIFTIDTPHLGTTDDFVQYAEALKHPGDMAFPLLTWDGAAAFNLRNPPEALAPTRIYEVSSEASLSLADEGLVLVLLEHDGCSTIMHTRRPRQGAPPLTWILLWQLSQGHAEPSSRLAPNNRPT